MQGDRAPYPVLTNNSSKTAAEYADKLVSMGIPLLVTMSSPRETTISYEIRTARPQSVCWDEVAADEFSQAGFSSTQKTGCVVLRFDMDLTYERLRRACDLIRKGVPYIATHPDVNCPTEAGLSLIAEA